jgi:colanic acid/amylovoran biosynthesis glycosyltransferase
VTPRRIAYVLNVFPKLSETFIVGELAELRRRGIEVCILSRRLPTEELRHAVVDRARLLDVTTYDRGEFARVLEAFRPDVIHAHFATAPAATARELAAALGVPFTFTAHGYDVHRRPPVDFAARAMAAGAVVTVSEANARAIEAFGVPRAHVRILPAGIDTARFAPGSPPAGTPHIVCVARLNDVKNHGLLLEACAILRRRGTPYRCTFVGDGPCRDALVDQRAALGLEGVVEFAGGATQESVLGWWRQASVGVLTSVSEGMPVALMEAAACGVPVVATAVGGVPELVEDGVTGLLAPSGDAAAVATALDRLLRDRALAARMGAAARERAAARFSIGAQVDGLLELWDDVLDDVAAPAVMAG